MEEIKKEINEIKVKVFDVLNEIEQHELIIKNLINYKTALLVELNKITKEKQESTQK